MQAILVTDAAHYAGMVPSGRYWPRARTLFVTAYQPRTERPLRGSIRPSFFSRVWTRMGWPMSWPRVGSAFSAR